MRFSLFVICWFLHFFGYTQNVKYEELDAFTREISKLQAGSEMLEDEKKNSLSFSAESFKIWFKDLKATNAVYKIKDGKETLEVTENIDLSKVKHVKTVRNKSIGILEIHFIADYALKTDYYAEGKKIKSETVTVLKLYCNNNDLEQPGPDLDLLIENVVGVSDQIKVHKGLLKKEPSMELQKKWRVLVKTPFPESINAYNAFFKEHPKSVYATEAQSRYAYFKQLKDRQIEVDKLVSKQYTLVKENFETGLLSYKNYHSFHIADSILSKIIVSYSLEELGGTRRNDFIAFRNELRERYHWNKSYFQNKDQVALYDSLNTIAIGISNKHYKADVNMAPWAVWGVGSGVSYVTFLIGIIGGNKKLWKGSLVVMGISYAILGINYLRIKSLERKKNKAVSEANKAREPINELITMRDKALKGEKFHGFPIIILSE